MTKHMQHTGIVEGVILGCAELPSLDQAGGQRCPVIRCSAYSCPGDS